MISATVFAVRAEDFHLAGEYLGHKLRSGELVLDLVGVPEHDLVGLPGLEIDVVGLEVHVTGVLRAHCDDELGGIGPAEIAARPGGRGEQHGRHCQRHCQGLHGEL